MKFRSIFLSLMLLVAMAFGSVTAAQDFDLDPCFGLAADDCAAINEASANGLGDAENFTLNLNVEFSADGLPEADAGFSSVYFAQSGSMSVSLAMGLIPVNIAGTFDVSTAINGAPAETMPLQFRLVDDMLYFEFEGEWGAIDLVRLLEDEAVQAQLEPALEAIESGDFGALTGGAGLDAETMPAPEDLAPLVQLLELPGLFNYVREGNDFVFTMDLAALQVLLDPENEELLNSIIDAASAVDPTAAFLIPSIPALVDTGIIGVNQTVNPDLNIVENILFTTNFVVPFGALTGDMEAPPVSVNLSAELGFTELGTTEAPVAPDNFEDVTDDFLEGFLGGM